MFKEYLIESAENSNFFFFEVYTLRHIENILGIFAMTAFDIQHFTFSNQIKKENVSACHEPLKDFDFVVIYCPILTAKIIYFLSFSIFLLFKR